MPNPCGWHADGRAYNDRVTDPETLTRTPRTIHADRDAGTLTIGWADDHTTTYDLTALRWLCPCAFCRGEAGMPGWLDSKPTLTAEQTQLVDIQVVGQYAVAPTWAEGHHTGYYTYALLRDRCPCAECAARRVRQGHAAPEGPGQAHTGHAALAATAVTTGPGSEERHR